MFFPGDVLLHLLDAPLVDNLTPQHAAGVGQAVARGGQFASGVVNAFAEDDPYYVGFFPGDNHLDGLAIFRAHLDLFIFHTA